VTFSGEEGIDAGGLTREWYSVLAKDVFNPGYCLFSPTADGATYQPNAMSGVNDHHLGYFKFVGRVVGKAVADGQLFDAHFTRSFYKHMLGLPVAVEDMEAADPEFYKNLKQIHSHSLDALGLDLTFSAESREFGRAETRDLVPGGRHLAVTDDTKAEYVSLMCRHRMTSGIHAQIEAFLSGFHDLVPPELISIFNEKELELLISGLPDVDLDDLQLHTEYSGWRPTDPGVEWFWAALRSFTREERALFLQFVTGSAKVPVEGFAQLQGMRGVQKFNVHKMYGSGAQLPAAHTCFNQLDLPEYESEAQTREKLLFALRECSEGFGFG
jgi:E3 ubiquitin-protein ligase HUWE1